VCYQVHCQIRASFVRNGPAVAHMLTACRTEMNSYRTGRMMEYTWHLIFGEPPIMEAVRECDLLYCADSL
jgi:hypothetical protein